jgi:hypothetical protein
MAARFNAALPNFAHFAWFYGPCDCRSSQPSSERENVDPALSGNVQTFQQDRTARNVRKRTELTCNVGFADLKIDEVNHFGGLCFCRKLISSFTASVIAEVMRQ